MTSFECVALKGLLLVVGFGRFGSAQDSIWWHCIIVSTMCEFLHSKENKGRKRLEWINLLVANLSMHVL